MATAATTRSAQAEQPPRSELLRLVGELQAAVEGEVRFDNGTRAIYSTDSSNYRQLPIGVVVPKSIDDVVATVAICHERDVPILSRGAGTSLAGQCCNTAVVIDFSKYLNRIGEVDRDRHVVTVLPGAILDDVRRVAESGRPSLTFGPDPSTHDHCTIGGMIGNNSCGTHSVLSEFYGPGPLMAHNVATMEVLTYDGVRLEVGPTSDQDLDRIISAGGRRGEIYSALRDLRDRYADLIRQRYPRLPRRVSGYNLDQLLPENGFNVAGALIGTESTCVTVLEATLKLVDSPPGRTVIVAGFDDVFAAAASVPLIREHRPMAIEGFDDVLVDNSRKLGMHTEELRLLPKGRGWLVVEFGAEIDLWKSEEVLDALDLCLSCKGCRAECPVGVDMATYKAEFLSHYYKRRPRPRTGYAMGLIYWWARAASLAPRLANFVTHAPVLSAALKRAGGIAPQREAPTFADQTFKQWFRSRPPRNVGGPPVVLWADTFNNHFHPDIGKATVEVLEAMGHRVFVPRRSLCCGRPLYDYGMLDTAKRLLRQTIAGLRTPIRAGVPVVGMEPSCVAVFRDELPNLYPNDADAQRLSKQTLLLSEFVENGGWQPPLLRRKAVVQAHCHHKAVMGFDSDRKVLEKMGLDFEILDSGCCGMAGSFGFERGEKYEVAMKAGERVLLPRVREAGPDTLVIADGFSCQTQIEQGAGRKAMHLAEVISLAMHDGSSAETIGGR